MNNNKTYQAYHNSAIREVPTENLKILVTLFINSAALNLGCKATKADVDRVTDIMSGNQFNFLPIEIAASAFGRGSLGKLKNEKTTLNPRNIYDWLTEVSLEYRQHIEHKEREDRLSANIVHFKDLERYPLGKAICWKIDHVSESDWDNVPLKKVAETIGSGHYPTLEKFGIKN